MVLPTERRKVLVVDDEPNVRESLRMLLDRSYEVDVAEGGDAALALLESYSDSGRDSNATADEKRAPDLAILDVTMPGMDGVELLREIKATHPLLPVIMLSANNTSKTAVQALKIGAVDYLNKPFDVDELLSLVEETIATGAIGRTAPSSVSISKPPTRAELANVPGDFGSMVGSHPIMQELYKKIDQIAVRDSTVLITGESGTGKELVAKELHRRSTRADGPFIALNCAAIPESLIESELFGHEKGSFTHAVEKRIGHFELADKGTLFLDEIGELSLPVQVKMLRFLQEQEFYRVGRSRPLKVDVRIITATNKNLEQSVKNGSFRQDLFYRVNVVSIESPPLRERIEDLPRLVQFFVKKLSTIYGRTEPSFSEDALATLNRYSWPGNVRELENVTESILALCNNERICPADLPARLRQAERGSADLKQSVLDGMVPFEEAEREFEKDIILKALLKSDFVQTRAAEMLGISRRILKYKMDKLGICDRPVNAGEQKS